MAINLMNLKKSNKELTIPEKFQANLKAFLMEHRHESGMMTCHVDERMAELPVDLTVFNPLEHWEFQHIFSFEMNCYPNETLDKKHNCLFGRSAFRLLDKTEKSTFDKEFISYDGYELWLLDDMTFVTLGYSQSFASVTLEERESLNAIIYRYPEPSENIYFDVEKVVEDTLIPLFKRTFKNDVDKDLLYPFEDEDEELFFTVEELLREDTTED